MHSVCTREKWVQFLLGALIRVRQTRLAHAKFSPCLTKIVRSKNSTRKSGQHAPEAGFETTGYKLTGLVQCVVHQKTYKWIMLIRKQSILQFVGAGVDRSGRGLKDAGRLSKCHVLCRSCHKEKTAEERRKSMRHGTRWMYEGYGCRCLPCKKAKSKHNASR